MKRTCVVTVLGHIITEYKTVYKLNMYHDETRELVDLLYLPNAPPGIETLRFNWISVFAVCYSYKATTLPGIEHLNPNLGVTVAGNCVFTSSNSSL